MPMHRPILTRGPAVSSPACLAHVLFVMLGLPAVGCANAKIGDVGQHADAATAEDTATAPDGKDAASSPSKKDGPAGPDVVFGNCDPLASTGCDSTAKCTALQVGNNLAIGCGSRGSKNEGEACKQESSAGVQTGDDCASGLACFNIGDGAGSTCHKFCAADGSNACPGSELCSVVAPGLPSSIKFCGLVTTCLPLEQTGCPSGKACYFSSTGAVCAQEGSKSAGDACTNANDCKSGSTCVSGHCASFCSMDSSGTPSCTGSDTGGTTCASFGVSSAEANLGYCKN
jgi:hypothetical protein